MTESDVRRNPAASRFELDVAGHLARLDYRTFEGGVSLVHTEVPPEAQGQGIGGLLVRAALDWARQEDLDVRARCGFVRSFLKRHPDLAEGVTDE